MYVIRMFAHGYPSALFFSVVVAATLWSCADTTTFGDPIHGAPITVSEALLPASSGKSVVVEGVLREVCRDEGCWFILSDGASEITVRYIGDNGFGIPVIARGRARVLGRLNDTVIGRNRVPELRARGVEILAK